MYFRLLQVYTLNQTGFFPVVNSPEEKIESEALKQLSRAIYMQSGLPRGVPTLLPMGLGKSGAELNSLYLHAFSEIILEDMSIISTLDDTAEKLQSIMDRTGAFFWPPDVSENGLSRLE